MENQQRVVQGVPFARVQDDSVVHKEQQVGMVLEQQLLVLLKTEYAFRSYPSAAPLEHTVLAYVADKPLAAKPVPLGC
jgi:hypothetical protein